MNFDADVESFRLKAEAIEKVEKEMSRSSWLRYLCGCAMAGIYAGQVKLTIGGYCTALPKGFHEVVVHQAERLISAIEAHEAKEKSK